MDIKKYLELQAREIERHKWIESEKAGRDLGSEAVIDWILKYADVFRLINFWTRKLAIRDTVGHSLLPAKHHFITR